MHTYKHIYIYIYIYIYIWKERQLALLPTIFNLLTAKN